MKKNYNKLLFLGLASPYLISADGCSGGSSNSTGKTNEEEQKRIEEERRDNEHRRRLFEENEKRRLEQARRDQEQAEIGAKNAAKEREKEEEAKFISDNPLSKSGDKILKNLPASTFEERKKSREDVADLEKKCSKDNLKLIAELRDKQEIVKIVENRNAWEDALKTMPIEAFTAFIKLNEAQQKFVLSFDEESLLAKLTKPHLNNLIAIFNNIKDWYWFNNCVSAAIGANSFSADVINYLAKKSKQDQEKFFSAYSDSRREVSGLDATNFQKIDMAAIKLYEKILEETKTSIDGMIKAGNYFWYYLVSSGIKLEDEFKDLLISCLDEFHYPYWKRVKSFVNSDKFKSLKQDDAKEILSAIRWNDSKNDEDFNAISNFLISLLDLPNWKNILKAIYTGKLNKFFPFICKDNDLMMKIAKDGQAIDIFKTISSSFSGDGSSNVIYKIHSMKTSDLKDLKTIIADFMNSNPKDLKKLQKDLEDKLK